MMLLKKKIKIILWFANLPSPYYVHSCVSFGPYSFRCTGLYMIFFIAVIRYYVRNDKFFLAQRMSLNQMRDPFCVYLFCMLWHVCICRLETLKNRFWHAVYEKHLKKIYLSAVRVIHAHRVTFRWCCWPLLAVLWQALHKIFLNIIQCSSYIWRYTGMEYVCFKLQACWFFFLWCDDDDYVGLVY